jgi:hypothetical protein
MRAMTKVCVPAAVLAAIVALAQGPGDPLTDGFRNPPDSAKPRTWWHWTNSNVTKEGITKDLEWMKRVGIGGFQLADVASGAGQTVEQKIVFGTPEWFDAVRHAAAEAQRLGLEMAVFSSAGWSETGGPWVKPEQAMKKLVWSETRVEGPRRFTGKLAQPPFNNGIIRNLGGGGRGNPDPTYYGDAAVVAYRAPDDDVPMAELHPTVSTDAGPVDGAPLLDDDLNSSLTVGKWVQYEFERPFAARAFTIAARGGIPHGRLAASDDGAAWRTVATMPGAQLYRGGTVRTFAFPQVRARFWRVELTGAAFTPATEMAQTPAQPAKEFVLSEAVLHGAPWVHRAEEKAGFSFLFEYETVPTPPVAGARDVVDLTAKMSKDGSLEWDVPQGHWTILRMGYSLTGSKNRPAVPSGLGYEVDKLSARHVEEYFHGYFDALAPLFGKGLSFVMMDSWEAGQQNWTEEIIAEFRRRRGYDPVRYLPALAGRVVESAQISDRFLWDFRRTLADMFADNHFGVLANLLRQRGIGVYAEAAGVSLEIPEDSLLNKSKVDIPMGEFWVRALHPEAMYYVDVRGAASASHAYGKTLVATETFTGGGYEAPFTLKKVADYWFAQGVNRLVFHTSAHQPLDTKPGNTMVGTHINRNITWAEQARPLMTYLARQSYMMQQGLAVADLAYLLREGAPSTMPMWGAGLEPAPPDGYDFDYVNADVVLNRMQAAEDGRLVLPDGMSYRVLMLSPVTTMTLPLARKIRDLVASGATVVGPKPAGTPGLTGYPEADAEVRAIGEDLWGDLDGVSRWQRAYGKGRVVWGVPPMQVMAGMKVAKDFECGRPLDSDVVWAHRRAGDAEIYYVANHSDQPMVLKARLRVSGKEAEIWHPDSGAITPAEYTISGDRTWLRQPLAERETIFVVFRRPAPRTQSKPPVESQTMSVPVAGAWDVTFPPKWGAPETLRMEKLGSWTANADDGVKYFSGTATYHKQVQATAELLRGTKVLLDLGGVRDVAEVAVNGKALGTMWKPPYRVDATGAFRAGANQVEVKVTNQWTNRQIGDRLAPPEKRVLAPVAGGRGGAGGFGPQTPAESGLLGPVTLIRVEVKP